MKADPEQRAVQLGEYIAAHNATVRAAAAAFGCSKSTVHKDVAVRLRSISPALYGQVRAVLARNKAERHLRGGAATGADTAAAKVKKDRCPAQRSFLTGTEPSQALARQLPRRGSFLHLPVCIDEAPPSGELAKP